MIEAQKSTENDQINEVNKARQAKQPASEMRPVGIGDVCRAE